MINVIARSECENLDLRVVSSLSKGHALQPRSNAKKANEKFHAK